MIERCGRREKNYASKLISKYSNKWVDSLKKIVLRN